MSSTLTFKQTCLQITTSKSRKITLNIPLPPQSAYRIQWIMKQPMSWHWQLTTERACWLKTTVFEMLTFSRYAWPFHELSLPPLASTVHPDVNCRKAKNIIQLGIQLKPTYIFWKQVFGILDPGICVEPWLIGGPQAAALPPFLQLYSGVRGLKPYQSPYKEVDIDSKENPVPWPCQLVSSLSRAYVQCKKHFQEVLN